MARKHLTQAIYLQDSGVTLEGLKFWGSPVNSVGGDWAFSRDRMVKIRKHWDLVPDNTGYGNDSGENGPFDSVHSPKDNKTNALLPRRPAACRQQQSNGLTPPGQEPHTKQFAAVLIMRDLGKRSRRWTKCRSCGHMRYGPICTESLPYPGYTSTDFALI
jgi:hypothetical protein